MNGAPIPLPPPIKIPNQPRVVFVRFLKARHRLVIDVDAQTTTVESEITVEVPQYGRPVIDLTPAASTFANYFVDGQKVPTVEAVAPVMRRDSDLRRRSACFRAVDQTYEAGSYVVHVSYELNARDALGVTWSGDRVSCFFSMSDYKAVRGRHFLERYLPANLEFDRYPIQLDVEILGTKVPHVVIANGAITGDLVTRFSVTFPDWYSSSCPFFFLAPRDAIVAEHAVLGSKREGDLPVTVFATRRAGSPVPLPSYLTKLESALPELERDFGPFPHDRLIVFAGEKGMEYAGAVTCTETNLIHELVHCYFGRSVLPVNGDSGWIDEAVANWYTSDRRAAGATSPPVRRNIGALSPYRRETIEKHGLHGKRLLSHLDAAYGNKLLGCLSALHRKLEHQQLDSRSFQGELERQLGVPLTRLFDRCVYGLKD